MEYQQNISPEWWSQDSYMISTEILHLSLEAMCRSMLRSNCILTNRKLPVLLLQPEHRQDWLDASHQSCRCQKKWSPGCIRWLKNAKIMNINSLEDQEREIMNHMRDSIVSVYAKYHSNNEHEQNPTNIQESIKCDSNDDGTQSITYLKSTATLSTALLRMNEELII